MHCLVAEQWSHLTQWCLYQQIGFYPYGTVADTVRYQKYKDLMFREQKMQEKNLPFYWPLRHTEDGSQWGNHQFYSAFHQSRSQRIDQLASSWGSFFLLWEFWSLKHKIQQSQPACFSHPWWYDATAIFHPVVGLHCWESSRDDLFQEVKTLYAQTGVGLYLTSLVLALTGT